MSTYYAVLGVSPQATAADIRRAYRGLVLLTHPDRTPDPAAHRRYLAINEAYETLSHEARRRQYDARLAQPTAPPVPTPKAPPPHRDPALRRRGRPAAYARRAPAADDKQYASQFARLAPVMRVIAGLGAMVVVLLWLDSRLLSSSVQQIRSLSYSSSSCDIRTDQAAFQGPKEDFGVGSQVKVHSNPWFKQIRNVQVLSGPRAGLRFRPVNLYDDMWLLPALLGIASGAALWPRLSGEQVFKRAFVSGALLLICLIFLAAYG